MARRKHRNVRSKEQRKTLPKPGKGQGHVWKVAAIIASVVLAAIPFIYGKYCEFNIDDAFDGALNVYSARSIVDGQKLGVDVVPTARPATLLVNVIGVSIFGFSEFGPKIIQTIMQVLALGLMFYTLRKAYGPLAAAVSLIMAAFYLSLPPYAKFGNVKEQYMVACMLVTACGMMLRYMGGRWWCPVISGMAAVNIYYFKPTGASVIIALGLWLILQPILRRRTFRQTGVDIFLLATGMVIGIVPLVSFYAWQGQASYILNRFPGTAIKLCAIGIIVAVAIYFLIKACKQRNIGFALLQKVRRRFWIMGAIVLTAMFVPWVIYFAFKGELESYLYHFGPTGTLMRLNWTIQRIIHAAINEASASTGYVAGSKEASVFQTQFADVFGYYRSFVIPIGLSLVAVGWRKVTVIAGLWQRIKSKTKEGDGTIDNDVKSESDTTTNTSSKAGEHFVLLLALWWILDMAFIWVSPRSYVQYFLPLNASAAMLAAYAIYRCSKQQWGLVWILAGWIIVDILLRSAVPSEEPPYFALRSLGDYWPKVGIYMIPLGLMAVACWLLKTAKLKFVLAIIAIVICGWMFSELNESNMAYFGRRVNDAHASRSGALPAWKQIGQYIRANSNKDDGLYVWGWVPGIYVQSQRLCPSKHPSESNMHAVSPKTLAWKTHSLVNSLNENKPRYIVDSQKVHFPYYDHPVFDLWPRWTEGKNKKFHLRYHTKQGLGGTKRMTVNDHERYSDQMMKQVEEFTYQLLTNPRRKGGAVVSGKAREMAQIERQRHEAMLPLREFVMNNYKFVRNFGTHVLFELKNNPGN